ncbi:SDR family oxidoreductase [Desulfotalea psychrophila]|uniref:NAD(P)-binding domain-containing protein n=1 Tax=Desulfotalea psychrophila (strain LSv54 / DSM 12343) TaxID=177439 RepID=Q6AK19_DESPS|nr:SDR family oxidoreductase [Desulfotalea psychrophila]CAG37307.1 conserved hypothetical protein [Desulfotalea psychrophila LSv54]
MPDKPQKKTVLITGATGYIGRKLTHRLVQDATVNVRLLVRNRNKVQVSIADKVDIREGSTFDKDSLKSILTGIDTAFYLIHSMDSGDNYRNLDKISATNFREACIVAGVRRIIYLGGLGVKESASEHLLSRIETGEILSERVSDIETIWLRAGVIIGSGSASFEIIRNLCQKLPLMITPRWVRSRTQPIGIDDVLNYLQSAIALVQQGNLIIDIGSEDLNFQQMMEQAAEVMGLKRYLFPVPVLTPRLSSYWLILFTPIPYRLAAALVEGLKSESVLQNDNAERLFPDIRPSSFKQAVEHAMDELERNQIINRWCDSNAQQACNIKDFDNPPGAILRDTRIVPFARGEQQKDIFLSACSIGGEKDWFRYNFLWMSRGTMDKIAAYGLSSERRLNSDLRIGDALGFWKVADLKAGKRLLLHAQMKIPGEAWLEFDVHSNQLVQTAHFLPKGLWGRLYWYSALPYHRFIFNNLAKTIVKTARRIEK